jgi:hypothetical protein
MKRSGRNKTNGTNHHERWVVEKATSDPTKRVTPSSWSQRRGAPTTVPADRFTLAQLPIVTLVSDGGVSSETAFNRCLDTMVDLPQEAQHCLCCYLWLL